MDSQLTLRIVLEKPTIGVDFGLQEGKGNDFKSVQTKRSNGENLVFECMVKAKLSDKNIPVFLGAFAQGPANERFIYIDIGKFTGQKGSCWDRRLKIPLAGIASEMIQKAFSNPDYFIETVVPGTAKDGGPNCGTVKPFNGWKLEKAQ